MAMFIRPAEGHISSPFGIRIHPITKVKTAHKGVDLAKNGNVPVYAAAAGRVFRVGELGTYGNVVMITHFIDGETYDTVYAHLKSYNVKVGDIVKQGQQIGLMGNTGGSTGQHLHFELHIGRWKVGQPNAVNPMMYLPLEIPLRRDDKGPAVKEFQQILIKAGAAIKADGYYGSATEGAVKDFQVRNKLSVDGIAGPATQKKIREILNKVEVASTTKGTFRIHTGTFKNSRQLADAVDQIKKDFNFMIYEKAENTGFDPTYRIFTGTFNTKEAAEAARKQITSKYGWITYLIDESK